MEWGGDKLQLAAPHSGDPDLHVDQVSDQSHWECEGSNIPNDWYGNVYSGRILNIAIVSQFKLRSGFNLYFQVRMTLEFPRVKDMSSTTHWR